MNNRTIMPFGPQHPLLMEPFFLELSMDGEVIRDAIPASGYVRRGMSELTEKNRWPEMVYVVERICGACSFMHAWGYCLAVEGAMKLNVPLRGAYLRLIWSELSRLQSHLRWLALTAAALGFESLYMHTLRLREDVVNILEETAGARVILSVCKVGGVRRDIDKEKLSRMAARLRDLTEALKPITEIFLTDRSIVRRMAGIGALSAPEVTELHATGPVARASGVPTEARVSSSPLYAELGYEPCLEKGGDVYARMKVRIRELYQSMELILQAVRHIPAGEIATAPPEELSGEFTSCVDLAAGESFYYIKGGGEYLERIYVRTAANINIPSLVKILQGTELSDLPLVLLSVDTCVGCMER
jgi:ech hydrogenase subunit E